MNLQMGSIWKGVILLLELVLFAILYTYMECQEFTSKSLFLKDSHYLQAFIYFAGSKYVWLI